MDISTLLSTPLFELDLGDNGGRLAPQTLEELSQWLSTEVEFWHGLNPNVTENNRYTPLSNLLRELITILSTVTREGVTVSRSDVESLKDRIHDLYKSKDFLHSSTAEALAIRKVLDELEDDGEIYARVRLEPGSSHIPSPRTIDQWGIFMRSLLARYHLLERPVDDELNGRLHAANAILLELRTSHETQKVELETTVRTIGTAFNALQSNIALKSEEHNKLLKSHSDELEQTRKTFREELALRAPNDYWSKKRQQHFVMSIVWGILTVSLLASSVVFLWNNAKDFLEPTPITSVAASIALPPSQAASGSASIKAVDPSPVMKEALRQDAWRLGVFALMAVFGFWAIRLVVRMYLSQVHLHADASERIVMLQTYLALMEADKLADKEDRTLILQALFRPASDGIVKDEAAPPSIGEWLTRTGKA